MAITRSPADASEFLGLAEEAGAAALAVPAIELVARTGALADDFLRAASEHDPDYTIFLSSKAVSILFDAAERASRAPEVREAVMNTAVVAVGPRTRDALSALSIRTAHMPPPGRYSSVGIGEALTRVGAAGRTAIIPRSAASRPFLRLLLEKIGMRVAEVFTYDARTTPDGPHWAELHSALAAGRLRGIVVTSPSSARAIFEAMERRGLDRRRTAELLGRTRVAALGPLTSGEVAGLLASPDAGGAAAAAPPAAPVLVPADGTVRGALGAILR